MIKLVIEAKGIHSIDTFDCANALMYWQVYFHKRGRSRAYALIKILGRAKELSLAGETLFVEAPALAMHAISDYRYV